MKMFLLKASELSKKEALDWCAGTQQLWTVDGPNPCSILVRGFEELIGKEMPKAWEKNVDFTQFHWISSDSIGFHWI